MTELYGHKDFGMTFCPTDVISIQFRQLYIVDKKNCKEASGFSTRFCYAQFGQLCLVLMRNFHYIHAAIGFFVHVRMTS